MNVFTTRDKNIDRLVRRWRASLLGDEREEMARDQDQEQNARRDNNPLAKEESVEEDFTHGD